MARGELRLTPNEKTINAGNNPRLNKIQMLYLSLWKLTARQLG